MFLRSCLFLTAQVHSVFGLMQELHRDWWPAEYPAHLQSRCKHHTCSTTLTGQWVTSPLGKTVLRWPRCVKGLKKGELSLHLDLYQIMIFQRKSRMFCKNNTWCRWSMGSCLFFLPCFFFSVTAFVLCLPVFIDFAVLLSSLARWSLIAVAAVSEVHREIWSWWALGMRQIKRPFKGWRVGKHWK